jgi:hypothetical protein
MIKTSCKMFLFKLAELYEEPRATNIWEDFLFSLRTLHGKEQESYKGKSIIKLNRTNGSAVCWSLWDFLLISAKAVFLSSLTKFRRDVTVTWSIPFPFPSRFRVYITAEPQGLIFFHPIAVERAGLCSRVQILFRLVSFSCVFKFEIGHLALGGRSQRPAAGRMRLGEET